MYGLGPFAFDASFVEVVMLREGSRDEVTVCLCASRTAQKVVDGFRFG